MTTMRRFAGLLAVCTLTAAQAQFIDERKPSAPPAAEPVPATAPSQAPVPASSTAVAPVVAPALAAPAQTWEVRTTDLRIDRTLERWAQAAGWRLQWDAARHVEIGAPTTFTGSFESAVRAILSSPGIRLSEFPLEGCIYPNQPPLLRITRQGEQVAECPTEYQE